MNIRPLRPVEPVDAELDSRLAEREALVRCFSALADVQRARAIAERRSIVSTRIAWTVALVGITAYLVAPLACFF